jgi:hypothetical protein
LRLAITPVIALAWSEATKTAKVAISVRVGSRLSNVASASPARYPSTGRRTYEIFAGSWGQMADPTANPIGEALNTQPKYVASTTLTDPRWGNTTVLSSEVAAAVGELKAKPGRELQVHGSRTLIRWLLDNGLTSSTCSSSPWSSARARGRSPTPAGTERSNWSNRRPPPQG